MKTDLNHATREDLMRLAGIGAALADRIIAHRERIGRFSSVEELIQVPGVSERLLKLIAPSLTVGPEPEAAGSATATLAVTLERDGAGGGDYTGCTVSITGTKDAGDEIGPIPFAASAPTSPAGEATVTIPDRSLLSGEILARAVAPDGAELGSRSLPGPRLPDRVTIDAPPPPVATTQPNNDPAAGSPLRVRGRVIDEQGGRVPVDVQVVIWAATAQNPAEADFRALVVAATDALGHFKGPYPVGAFSAAHATVAVGEEPQTVAIPLDGEKMPESVILVIALPDEVHDHGDEPCDCESTGSVPRSPDAAELARADGTFSSDAGAGRCVDFTKPDRTLEEFTFAYVVRTTEPEIRGLTLDEPPRIGPIRIRDLFDRATLGGISLSPDAGETPAQPGAARTLANAKELKLDAKVLKSLTRDPEGISPGALIRAEQISAHGDLVRTLGSVIKPAPGRGPLSAERSIDWDDDPMVYEACTIAHGHVLRFKQEWVSDGYSMGNLLYSLPLAPGQKKQIAVVDWERRESAARSESLEAADSLSALVDRDRDISEIVTGAVRESSRGGSSASSSGFAAGGGIAAIGGAVGGLIGVGGGSSSADTDAWQTSSRNTAANALNQLRDRTIQSASSVRSQRSSVVQTVRQGERVTATTESVANYNHCHAITVQYFEVLRHLLVRQRLVDVQECLFVPLQMSWFTAAKALRWRSALEVAVPRKLRAGFAALDRIAHAYVGSDLPTGRYADESLVSVQGDLRLRFELVRPRDKDNDEFDPGAWSPLLKLFGFDAQDFHRQFVREQQFKDRVFLERLGARVASSVVGLLKIQVLTTSGTLVDLRIDPTLISDFRNDEPLYVTLRMGADLPPLRRADIKAVVISARLDLPGLPFVVDALPSGSRVIVESGTLSYRSTHHTDHLFRETAIRNDLTRTDDVRIETPLTRAELRNPREEDKELARTLLAHLNEHIEGFHHLLWDGMSNARRYMLLDGFEAPNSGGRSVASVVNNELIGIVGNSLVMPLARGFHLDPTFSQDVENPIDLIEHYQPNTPIEPSRIAVPTPGVYAEAVMGACNSCEQKDETRFWRWEESPLPDSPPQILPVSTESRRAEPPDLGAKDFAAPIIAMQNAPAAPDPTGLATAFGLLGQSGLFRDITGVEGTQANAAAALQGAFQTATTFGTKAADLALQGKMTKDIDKAMQTIKQAREGGLINDAQATELMQTAIRGLVGAGTTNPPAATTPAEVKELTDTAGDNNAAVKVTRPTGESVEVDARDPLDEGNKPIIILADDTATAETRSFRPSTNDTSGTITAEARFRRAPNGSRLRWSSPETGALAIDTPNAARSVIRGLRPGRRALDVDLLDGGGTSVASMKLQLSVPQYVLITENVADFDAALAALHLPGAKNDIIGHARPVVSHLLRTANVRTYWSVGTLTETPPAHVTAANLTTVTIRNKGADDGLTGTTFPVHGHDRYDERIEIYPGAYTDQSALDLDTETIALVTQLDASLGANPALEALAAKVYGRLTGATIAHEIVHALLSILIPGGHTAPPTPDDLMSIGDARTFRQRTGMENTAQVSPVDPSHYVDHGLGDILGIGPANQALIDTHFPVPPAMP